MGENQFIVRKNSLIMWIGIISMLFWVALIILMTMFPNDSASWWIYVLFILFFLLGAVITLAGISYELRVDGNEIRYRSSFRKTKDFNFKMIKSAIEKQVPGNEEQKKLAIYSENELLFTVESICIGYDLFVSRLQKEGIEITQTPGIQVSTKDPDKAHAKADKKARKKQKDAEDWADFEEQYPEKVKQHVKTCKILNGIGFAYYFSSFLVQLFNIFSPISKTMFSFGAIALFLIAVFYSVINSHIVNDEMERSSPKPSLVNALLAPGLFLGLTALTLYPIVYNLRTWMVFLTVAVIISFILLFVARERGIKKSTLISLLVYVFIFSYGATVAVNCELDFSEPESGRVYIESKSPGSSRSPPSVVVKFFFDDTEDRIRVPVGRDEFNRLNVGDILMLNTKPGLFGIRWIP